MKEIMDIHELDNHNVELKEKYIKEFPIPKGDKKEPYLIVFDAYIGQGKSTVSKIISKHDKSVIMNNDELRNWLDDYVNPDILYELQWYRLDLILKNNNSCILDSCSLKNWDYNKKYIDSLGYKYYVIRLVCDEDIIRERLSSRTKDGINFSIATYEDYLDMKKTYSRIDDSLISFTIDTGKDIEPQVIEFLNKYNLIGETNE